MRPLQGARGQPAGVPAGGRARRARRRADSAQVDGPDAAVRAGGGGGGLRVGGGGSQPQELGALPRRARCAACVPRFPNSQTTSSENVSLESLQTLGVFPRNSLTPLTELYFRRLERLPASRVPSTRSGFLPDVHLGWRSLLAASSRPADLVLSSVAKKQETDATYLANG